MAKIVKIRKGLDIKLLGESEKTLKDYLPDYYSIQPTEFRVLNPRLLVHEETEVKIGTPLVQDKKNEKIFLTSPVAGVVSKIIRGDKRKLEQIIIKSSHKDDFIDFGKENLENLQRKDIVDKLLLSGLWPYFIQRPYGIIANPEEVPDSIFISGFESAPLAPDLKFVMSNYDFETFQVGINVLKKLTPGLIHLNVNQEKGIPEMFLRTQNVQINQFSGPHPAGNVGVQIHHISPIEKGDLIWCLKPQDIISIGNLFLHGKLINERIYAICGSELRSRYYIKTKVGAQINGLIENNLETENIRVISGNVLTGRRILTDGFLSFYEQMLCVIPEGDYYEFLGWSNPGFNKFSVSRTFPSVLFKNKKWRLDTNTHGEERAFVVNGQYETVFPFEILPVYLLKSILTNDIEMMEKLGIYEVVEEDFALCEVICTSKIESQKIVSKGIEMMIKELS